jgi:guanosine-3',5'-bis(diphosphate) 3'-pyrophosphohydrolase
VGRSLEKPFETTNSILSDHNEAGLVGPVLKALKFAAEKHTRQRRKDSDASPYVNHLIDIAETLAGVGGIADLTTLQGAILHDTIEDTQATPDELQDVFGLEVRLLIEEVTDDKRLPKLERKRLQIECARCLSTPAKLIRIADKISNIRDVTHSPPVEWTLQRRREYLDWTERVVSGCRGCNQALENLYDRTLAIGRQILVRQAEQT